MWSTTVLQNINLSFVLFILFTIWSIFALILNSSPVNDIVLNCPLTPYIWGKVDTSRKLINYTVINFGYLNWHYPSVNQYVSWKTYLKVSVHLNPEAHVTITVYIFKMSFIKEIYHSSTGNRFWLPILLIHTYLFILLSLKHTVLNSEHLHILAWSISSNTSVELFNECFLMVFVRRL